MTGLDMHERLDELARRLPDPPRTSLDAVRARARQRHRRRTWSTGAASGVIVLLAAVVLGSVWPRTTGPVAPGIDDTFGPVLAEIRTCPSELVGCPDLTVDQALDQIVTWIEDEPAVTMIETHDDRAESSETQGDIPATGTVVVQIGPTPTADQILRDLVALPAVYSVALGTADQSPATVRDAGMPHDLQSGRPLGRLTVPVEGAEAPVVYEIWKPDPTTICFGLRPGSTCTHLTIRDGHVAGRFSTPDDGRPGCLSVVSGPGVDHVRVSSSDGTRLGVATTHLPAHLSLLELHVACWTDAINGVISGELIAPDGSIIDEIQ